MLQHGNRLPTVHLTTGLYNRLPRISSPYPTPAAKDGMATPKGRNEAEERWNQRLETPKHTSEHGRRAEDVSKQRQHNVSKQCRNEFTPTTTRCRNLFNNSSPIPGVP